MKKILFCISIFIFLTSAFILAYSPACLAFSDDDSIYYLDPDKTNTIEIWTEDQPWWDLNWKQRQQITISGSVRELTDYQTKIELNSENVGKNWNWWNNGADIIFVDDMNRKLNYYIESWKPWKKQTKIWVKVPSIPLNGTTIYMYYKNPGQVSESDGRNTFVYFDDFDKDKSWDHFWLLGHAKLGTTKYDATSYVSRNYSLKTSLFINKTNEELTEGSMSQEISLPDSSIKIDVRYKTSGNNWDNNKSASIKIDNITLKSLYNTGNKWTNGSSSSFVFDPGGHRLMVWTTASPGATINVNIDDIRIRKYIEQEPIVEISNWYGLPQKKVIALKGTSQLGMLFNIGGEFEQMKQKKLEIEEKRQEEIEQEEIEALEEERRKRQEGFQIQETAPNTSTQLYIIDKQTLGYVIGGNVQEGRTIGGNVRGPVTIGAAGAKTTPVSAPAQQAIDTAVSANQGSSAAKAVTTSAKTSAKSELTSAATSLTSAGLAMVGGNPVKAASDIYKAGQSLSKASQLVEVTKTSVEIENRFTDISETATSIASHEISRQVSSGGYSQSFTQQEIQSAVNKAITQSQGGQVGKIILEKGVETEQGGLVKEIFQVTVVKSAKKELNIVAPQEIADDITDPYAPIMINIPGGNCPFGCSKPEVASPKKINEIDEPNLLIRVEEEDNLQVIKIDRVLKGGASYHSETIPIVIEEYAKEDKKILVIKIGETTKIWHGADSATVKKIEIDITNIKEGVEIEFDNIPATDILKPLPIVVETPDNDYTPIEPDYVMTDEEKLELKNDIAINQALGGTYGFDKYEEREVSNINDYNNEKQSFIDRGYAIDSGVDDNGNPYFIAAIHKKDAGIFGKTEAIKMTSNLPGQAPTLNLAAEYIVPDRDSKNPDKQGSISINLNNLVSDPDDASGFTFEVENVNSDLFTTKIIDGVLFIESANDTYYGKDIIKVIAYDPSGKTNSVDVSIATNEKPENAINNIALVITGKDDLPFGALGKDIRNTLLEQGYSEVIFVESATQADVDKGMNEAVESIKSAEGIVHFAYFFASHGDPSGDVQLKTDEGSGSILSWGQSNIIAPETTANFAKRCLNAGADQFAGFFVTCYSGEVIQETSDALGDDSRVTLFSVTGDNPTSLGQGKHAIHEIFNNDGIVEKSGKDAKAGGGCASGACPFGSKISGPQYIDGNPGEYTDIFGNSYIEETIPTNAAYTGSDNGSGVTLGGNVKEGVTLGN